MAQEIVNNLPYLMESLTNLPSVLLHCVQNNIITIDNKEQIMAGVTSQDRNYRFFGNLINKDWEEIKSIIKILRETSNAHCAEKILGERLSTNQMQPTYLKGSKISNSENRKTKRILGSKWWPVEKTLPKAFLEREQDGNKLIEILKDNLVKSKYMSTVINQGTSVSGMGAIGKTTIAKWFAINFNDSYDHIVWIDCGEENLYPAFAELAKELKVDTTLRLQLLSKKCFSLLEASKCLFIFDNAECYQGNKGVRDVLPKHDNFHTIITSRTKEWGSESGDGIIPQMHLTAFEKRESLEFLPNNLKVKLYTKDQLEELRVLLGDLPLALHIAVTAINIKKLSIKEYIQRIKQTGQNINANFDDYERTINKTMKISLDIIKNHEEDPKQRAYKILLVLGYTKPDLVPFQLLQLSEGLSLYEVEDAMEMLEKYSLITIEKWETMNSCSIHRLLQQVIRYNDKENNKVTLKRILSVEGFPDYKLLPYLYADQEIKSLFPKVQAELIQQDNLEKLIEQRRFNEAVEISRMIKNTLRTPMAEYNYAVCLEKIDELIEAEIVVKAIYNSLKNDTAKYDKIGETLDFYAQLRSAINMIERYISVNGLWKLSQPIQYQLVRGSLFLLYRRLGMNDRVHEIVNEDCPLIVNKTPQTLNYVMQFLKSPSIGNYQLENGLKVLIVKIGSKLGKAISLIGWDLSETFPNDLDQLSLENVEMLNEEGHPLKYYNISTTVLNSLKSLSIKCIDSTKFAIAINDNLPCCRSITLDNCFILLQNGRQISPMEIDLRRISFTLNDDEVANICLNDLFDFQQTKKLTLHGSNTFVKLGESLSIDEICLDIFNRLDWSDFKCTVKEFNIKNTVVPMLDKDTSLCVMKLHLQDCFVHLVTLFFLSKTIKEMTLDDVTIEIDKVCVERKMKICTPVVILNNIKLIQDSVELTEIIINDILSLEKIKKLTVTNDECTVMYFDLNEQISVDCLELAAVELINWDTSRSGVKILKLRDVEIQDILTSHFKVTEMLAIRNSVINATSLNSISAFSNNLFLKDTSIILNYDLDANNTPPKLHYLNGLIKEIKLQEVCIFKGGDEVDNFLVNEFINVIQLNVLNLSPDEEGRSRYVLDLENLSLSLDILSLKNVTVLNWDKGQGFVNKMKLHGISLQMENSIKINSLDFSGSIDLSCLPKNIQRLQLKEGSAVSCKSEVDLISLDCIILLHQPSELKYFTRCPNLTKVELRYSEDDELLLNLQCMPKTIKTIKLHGGYRKFPPPSLTIIGTENREFKLETLIIHDLVILSPIESALDILKPDNIIISKNIMLVVKEEFDVVIKLMKTYKTVAIGPMEWKTDEHFLNCRFSKFVNHKAEFYIFENQKGRVLQKIDFVDLVTL